MGCSALHLFHLQVSSQLVEKVHDAGMTVVAWTVNGAQRVEAMLDVGVDAIISEDVPGSPHVNGVAGGLARDGGSRGESGA